MISLSTQVSGEPGPGHWSYTHGDDERAGGRILRLAEFLQAEFALLTGSSLEIFIDRESLKWGEEWELRIEDALATTTFFIPVITPLYFKSQECRKELLRFIGNARSVGAEDLVLPLLYVDVPEIHLDDPGDEAVAAVKARQWQDCCGIRLLAEDDPAYRQKVNELATRLIEINESLPVEREPEAKGGTSASRDPDPDEPGHLERFAADEAAIPRWLETMDEITEVMRQIGVVADRFGDRMERSDQEGANFAKKVVITRSFAEALAGPAAELLRVGQAYSGTLVDLDPAILSLARLVDEDPDQASHEEIREFHHQLNGLTEVARETTAELQGLVGVLDQARRMSRELAPPIDKMKQGLRHIYDAQSLFDEWERRFAQLDRERGGTALQPPPDEKGPAAA